jgi:hypothetical protein
MQLMLDAHVLGTVVCGGGRVGTKARYLLLANSAVYNVVLICFFRAAISNLTLWIWALVSKE